MEERKFHQFFISKEDREEIRKKHELYAKAALKELGIKRVLELCSENAGMRCSNAMNRDARSKWRSIYKKIQQTIAII